MSDQPSGGRRSYGTGRLYVQRDARGRESWYGRWRVGNRRFNRKLGAKRERGNRDGLTRAQAERELRRRIEVEEPAGGAERASIEEIGRRFVANLEARGRKASTLAAHEGALRVHLVPFFGEKALARITVADVEAFIASRRDWAPKSVRNYLGTLHSVFEFARIRPNPVQDARRPEAQDVDPDIRFLGEDELAAVLRSVPSDTRLGPTDRLLYMTAALTGARQGELLALRWQDVDWSAMRIRIRRSYARKRAGREAQFGRPKSKRSSRSVPMHDRLAAALDAHHRQTPYDGDEDLVFAHPQTGGPLDGTKVLKRFKVVLKAAGVRQIRFHDLRHTFGTRMAAAGVPMRTLQEWMGHRDIKTTMIYADYAPSDREAEFVTIAFPSVQLPELNQERGELLVRTSD
jgi:integrase